MATRAEKALAKLAATEQQDARVEVLRRKIGAMSPETVVRQIRAWLNDDGRGAEDVWVWVGRRL